MERIELSKHIVSPTNSYLFDTNVWLYINGPIAGSRPDKQKKYANLLHDIISRDSGLYVTSLILSEYINAVLRMGFRLWKGRESRSGADFKRDYRPTDDYSHQLELARAQVEDILKFAKKRPDDFNAINIDKILASMSNTIDYNDSYLLRNCEKGMLYMVSDDGDMTSLEANVKVIVG